MPKSDNQKLKIFYIRDYLERNSDENHPVKASVLIDMLDRQYNIKCDRKTVYSDINALKDYGLDIITVPGKNGGFHIDSRKFEIWELKMLIDAVQSSRFLTEKKSHDLIGKLCELCNENDANLVRRTVLVSGRVKSMNNSIAYNIDSIQEAISANRQISFYYFDWNIRGEMVKREKSYVASPYGLLQKNENYYLLAWSERHGITSYRVDRMKSINMTNDKRIPCPELTGKALNSYTSRRFQMFAGDPTTVKMRFHNSLVNSVIDQFGPGNMFPDGDDYFVLTADVDVSDPFFSWILEFGGKAQILYPQRVVDRYCKLLEDVLSQYK